LLLVQGNVFINIVATNNN